MTARWDDRPNPAEDEDGGDYRNNRHQLLSCLIHTDDGRRWIFPYLDLPMQDSGPADRAEFRIRLTDRLGDDYDLVILGFADQQERFDRVIRMFCTGKRELIASKPGYVRSVRVVKVPE